MQQLDSFRDCKRKLKLFLLDHPFYSLKGFFLYLKKVTESVSKNTSKTRHKQELFYCKICYYVIRPVYWIINHVTEYGLSTSAQKTKLMAFKARDPVRTKTVIDNKIIEQVNLLNQLGNMISYEGELDIDNKLNNFLKITGILNNVFRPQKTLRKTNKTTQYTSPSSIVIWQ